MGIKTDWEVTHADGTYQIRLAAPASAAQRYSITLCSSQNQIYALGAALGACWRGPGAPTHKIASFNHDFLRYGQAVFDDLDSRGVPFSEFMEVAGSAFVLCLGDIEDLVSGDDVEAIAAFTEATSDPSTM